MTSASPGRIKIPGGGVVVSNEIEVTIDIEAILDADLVRDRGDRVLPRR